MKRLLILLAVFLPAELCAAVAEADTAGIIRKKGWNFGPLPVVSYSSDLGFQYGVCCDMFNYDDGSEFPKYKDHFYVEVSRYTKQQTLFHLLYDSDYLIPNINTTLCVSYQLDPLYYFYGYNGIETYDPALNLNPETGSARYSHWRGMFRLLADFQGKICGDHLLWAAGVGFRQFRVDDIKFPGYDPGTSLFNDYKYYGLIKSNELNGGAHLELKAGLVYDSRNFKAAPDRGIWAELFFTGSPDMFGTGSSFLKLSAHFRQYLTLIRNRMVFAYHLAYQGTLAGETPFYLLSNIYNMKMLQTSSEGLGSLNSIRGVLTARVVGESYAWANFEFRIRLFSFNLINQSWYVATNPFFDCGMVVKPYRIGDMARLHTDMTVEELTRASRAFHSSAGLGLKLAMNQNFMLSVEGALPLNRNDGPFGCNVGFNYIF
ncbi:MAG: outer membrane protein assembly factor [Bacteroidales bacterium]|nr:outer membrane protein assembly factor [Bacteroidales bacterium]